MDQQDQLSAVKLRQLRSDLQDGFSRGAPTPWVAEEIKLGGRTIKASRRAAAPDA